MKESLRRLTSAGDDQPFFDEFPPQCLSCIKGPNALIEKCPIDGKRARHCTITGTYGSIFECNKAEGLVKSAKIHANVLSNGIGLLKTLGEYKRRISEKYDKAFKRLLHNVERNDAHIIQDFQNVVSEAEMIAAHGRHRTVVSSALKKDLPLAAKAMLNIFKAAISIKNEITIYQRLYVDSVWRQEPKNYKVHRVFMNTAYKFYEDFSALGISLKVGDSYDEVLVDFESISVVLFHLLDNAAKYAYPNSTIEVSFLRAADTKTTSIVIQMTSVAVEENEKKEIHLEGRSGIHAIKLGRSGKGFGMSIAADIMCKTDLHLDIKWDIEKKITVHENIPYTRNVFTLAGMKLVKLQIPGHGRPN